ncbi:MAG: ribonuclease P protein subunit [Candidatus Thermoplasmatota archaeon]|jgi:ribonuclease P protein subunit POP4|nr:ribonuclease P protein subunit [Candidatus Thermoplasmatota archaeon]MDP7264513.1 ribonuclease P protein subunit [Candidatus Thermoplasmatota archaeon]
MRDERNILQHEFIGLEVRVIDTRAEGYIGLQGIVVDESKNMLEIDDGKKRIKMPKAGNTFVFNLKDGPFKVDGNTIRIRSEDRTKRLRPGKQKRERRDPRKGSPTANKTYPNKK